MESGLFALGGVLLAGAMSIIGIWLQLRHDRARRAEERVFSDLSSLARAAVKYRQLAIEVALWFRDEGRAPGDRLHPCGDALDDLTQALDAFVFLPPDVREAGREMVMTGAPDRLTQQSAGAFVKELKRRHDALRAEVRSARSRFGRLPGE